jgi:hypothetical protein
MGEVVVVVVLGFGAVVVVLDDPGPDVDVWVLGVAVAAPHAARPMASRQDSANPREERRYELLCTRTL